MELGNAGKYEERIAFCQKILEIFDWQDEDDSCFRCGIGESLFREGKIGEAYEVVRKVTWGVSCYADNSFLFMRARQLADYVGKENESNWYQQQLDAFENSMKKWEMDEDEIFDEFTAPKQIPIVKEKKIYPNDPCPCGSGKKYKKCCGKIC